MTSDPVSPSGDSSLPPRHRPTLEDLAKETSELDLWAFDDELEQGEQRAQAGELPETGVKPLEPPKPIGKGIPLPRPGRESFATGNSSGSAGQGAAGGDDQVRLNVSRSNRKRPSGEKEVRPREVADFEELEDWEITPTEPDIPDLPEVALADLREGASALPAPPVEVAPPAAQEITPPGEGDVLSPAARPDLAPVSLRPRLRLNGLERAGLIALLGILLGGGLGVLIYSLNQLPRQSERATANDFPVAGKYVRVRSATSYWRAPVTDGPDQDVFKRGTQLLPVVELEVSGGPGVVRVFFRNDEGAMVGDVITRPVQGDGLLKVAATAGFEDSGMHAAYRTGESEPWTIEVLEAPNDAAGAKDAVKLFEMNISTDRR